MEKPQIAILTENTLEGLGLSAILERMMPFSEVYIYSSMEDMLSADMHFFHHFVSSSFLLNNAAIISTLPRVVVLSHGEEKLPMQGFHLFNVCQPEKEMVRAILSLANAGHHQPAPPTKIKDSNEIDKTAKLTKRETDVLKLIVHGMLNKEIANELGVALTTVITHRKNLTAKLGIRSVSGLTIYAVTHGLVRMEEI